MNLTDQALQSVIGKTVSGSKYSIEEIVISFTDGTTLELIGQYDGEIDVTLNQP